MSSGALTFSTLSGSGGLSFMLLLCPLVHDYSFVLWNSRYCIGHSLVGGLARGWFQVLATCLHPSDTLCMASPDLGCFLLQGSYGSPLSVLALCLCLVSPLIQHG